MNSRYVKLKHAYNNKTKNQRILMILEIILFLILVYAFILYLVGHFIEKTFDKKLGGFYYAINEGGIPIATGIFLVVLLFIILQLFRDNRQNEVEQVTKDGTFIMKNKQAGSRRWLTRYEVEKNFFVGNPEDAPGTIIGVWEKDPSKIVSLPKMGKDANHNVLICSIMGTGKTVAYVINGLIQAIKEGYSFIVNDPKSEILTKISYLASKIFNYDTKVLNMANLDRSQCWNCVREVIAPETKRLSGLRLKVFVDTFMLNAGDPNDKTDFWFKNALNLVKAVIGYAAWEYESDKLEKYIKLYKQITDVSDQDSVVLRMKNTFCSFVWIEEKIREEAKKANYDLNEINELLAIIDKGNPEIDFTIGRVYDLLMKFGTEDEISEEEWDDIPNWYPPYHNYREFISDPTPQVRGGAIHGAQQKFQLFADYKLREILSHEGITLYDINLKKSAYFSVCNDTAVAYRCINSLFVTFFYMDVISNFDKQKQIADSNGTENPCIPVVAMLEEFFSLGTLTGDASLFAQYMASSRSRMIYTNIIIQYYNQLTYLYGNELKDGIESACDTKIFMRLGDDTSAQWASRTIGTTTVMNESHSVGRPGLFGLFSKKPNSATSGISASERPLVYPADFEAYPDYTACFQYKDQYPGELKTYYYENHPFYKKGYMQDLGVNNFVTMLDDRISEFRVQEAKDKEVYLNLKKRIEALSSGKKKSIPSKTISLDSMFDSNKPAELEIPHENLSAEENEKTEELTVVEADDLLIINEDTGEILGTVDEDTGEVFNTSETKKDVSIDEEDSFDSMNGANNTRGRRTMSKPKKKKARLDD